MTTTLKARISNLTNEVKELHPLLESVFRKMPSLEKVENTHGVFEKGADFILTKVSEELGDTEYIGVIAKVGKITQSISSVEEQIDECTLKRFSCNGKKEIYLSEVWIVVNGTISNNAKEKIYEKFKTQKIKFIDINTLYDLTLKYVPDFGVEVNVVDAMILSDQREKCIKREEKFSLLPSEQGVDYIQPEILKVTPEFNEKDKKVNIFDLILTQKFISIESQMGGGKSKLLNYFVNYFTDLEVYKKERIIPIYLSSKEVIGSNLNLNDYVENTIDVSKLVEDKERRFLLIVDGVDEVKMNDKEIADRLISLIDEANESQNLKLVIASRDINNTKIENYPCFVENRYRIKPLGMRGVVRFLESICVGVNLKGRLLEDLKKSDLFKVMPKTPIAAIILAKLLVEGSEELPMNLTELYSKYCELSLGRWDIEKGLKTQKQYEVLDALVGIIASYMMENNLPSLSKSEAKEIFIEYLSERNLELDADALFSEMLERSGILLEDTSKDIILFKHRSFAEFFFAKNLAGKQNVDITEKVFHPYWLNSYFFYIGLKRDCPDLLNEIIDYPIQNEGHRLSKIMNLGSFLLAGYQSPYSVIKRGILHAFSDASDYYVSAINGEIDSLFTQLPAMHLMGLLRGLLSHGYNYTFFEKSISECIEEVATNPDLGEEVPYTLYLLEAACSDLKSKPMYDNLIDIYGAKLPTIIQLAIGHDSDGFNQMTPAMKKVQKRIMKSRKTSRAYDAQIRKLYDISINGELDLTVNRLNKH